MSDLPYQFNNGASLVTPAGTVTFVTSGDGLHLDPTRCVATQNVRAPHTDIPQGDGAYLHNAYLGLVLITLVGRIKADDNARTGFADLFIAACRSILRADGTYFWSPSGQGSRTITVRLADGGHPEVAGPWAKEFRVTLRAANP